MAAPQRLIMCAQRKFGGKWLPILFESDLETPLVAMANILSLRGELPEGPHKTGFYPVEQVLNFVATRLSAVKGYPIVEAEKRLSPLAVRIEGDVNFRKIKEVCFPHRNVFTDLSIPLYHGWKVVPKAYLPQDFPDELIERAAQESPVTPQESGFIGNTYEKTECTAYGYTELAAVLQGVRSMICVLCWRSSFYTLHKVFSSDI